MAALFVCEPLGAQEGPLPSPSSPPPATPSLVARLRIPGQLIVETIDREFHRTVPVTREVLGTHSRGWADCQGVVRCELIDNDSGAEFSCYVVGTVESQTCGVNGPATIRSRAQSSYTARKMIYFDGQRLWSKPAELNVNTQLFITGIGSTEPRLRGRLVKRVARQRVSESHAQAEAITAALIRQDLQRQIDSEFDERLATINQRLATRLSIMRFLAQSGRELSIRSLKEFVEIDLTDEMAAKNPPPPMHRQSARDAIELWLPIPSADISPSTAVALLSYIPAWMIPYFADNPGFQKVGSTDIGFERMGQWLIVELQDD